MRIFVTGASGWIGSAVVPELLAAGHQVLGLARSEKSADALRAAGAEVQRGELADLAALRAGAEAADGVIHLAFIHDFTNYGAALGADRDAIATLGEVLTGSDRPFVIASGLLGVSPGRVGTEADRPPAEANPRIANGAAVLDLAEQGVRSSVVRLPPTVHGVGDHGFVAELVAAARRRGTAAYVGDGNNRWSAVHREDAARLFRLAVESAAAGSVLHATGDEGVPARTIAERIGAGLGLPVTSVAPEQAAEHFGWIGPFFAMDGAASSAVTRAQLGWQPTGPSLLEDLDAGAYFPVVPA